ncbi:MAG TPA: DUF3142 domain-containing protein [Steroidobacteraceae bacterium]
MHVAADRFIAIAALTATALVAGCGSTSKQPFDQEAYIWQRTWTPAVSQAVRDVPPPISAWRVLIAQAGPAGWRRFAPDIPALESGHRPLIAVIRIDGQRRIPDAQLLVSDILASFQAFPHGVWGELEIDYDCPTHGLAGYVRLLSDLRSRLPPDIGLSVTALPTWITSDRLRELLSIANESVLQVHSVIDPHRGLFDPALAKAWIKAYARVSPRPFYVALPDYGSRVEFDDRARLVDVISEDEVSGPERAGEELQPAPATVASFLSALRANHPSSVRGVAWFRLPIDGDQRIWGTETWRRVVSGQALMPHLVTTVLKDNYGAYQLRLSNDGNADAPMPRGIAVPVSCLEADGEDLYDVQQRADETVWRLSAERWLTAGHSVRVGWIRCPFKAEGVRLENY